MSDLYVDYQIINGQGEITKNGGISFEDSLRRGRKITRKIINEEILCESVGSIIINKIKDCYFVKDSNDSCSAAVFPDPASSIYMKKGF